MKNKKIITIITIFIIVIIGFGNRFLADRGEELKISDWLIYENIDYGYRFKYPNNLEIIDGKDPRYSLYNIPKSTFIILLEKYINIKHPDPYNPETFKNYEISISEKGLVGEFGDNLEDIIKNLTPPEDEEIDVSKKITKINGNTIIIFSDFPLVYVIGENSVYSIFLDGPDPAEQWVQGWIKNANDKQLMEWTENYPNNIKIFEGIYSTFEIITQESLIDQKKIDSTKIEQKDGFIIYTNLNLGIKELKYPNNIYIRENKNPQGEDYILLSTLPIDDPRQNSSIGIISSMVISIDKNKTIEEILEDYRSDNYSGNFVKIKKDNIGNKKGYKISYIGGYSGETNFIYLSENSDGGGILTITYTDTHAEIFNNIVSSIISN